MKAGQAGKNNGAVLFSFMQEPQLYLQVGYGLEGRLTDLQAGRIIRHIIAPQFKSGRFDEGVGDGVTAMNHCSAPAWPPTSRCAATCGREPARGESPAGPVTSPRHTSAVSAKEAALQLLLRRRRSPRLKTDYHVRR